MLQAQMWAQTDGNRAWWERPEALDEGDKLVGYSLLIHRDGFSYMLFVEPQADGILVDAQFGRPIPSSSKIPTALMDRIRDTNNKLPSHIVFAFRKCGPEVMELVLATKVRQGASVNQFASAVEDLLRDYRGTYPVWKDYLGYLQKLGR